MDEYIPVAAKVLGVFLVMLTGALARRLDWLSSEADRSLANLTASILLPAFYFDRILASSQLESLGDLGVPPLVGFATTATGFAAAAVLMRWAGPSLGMPEPAQQRAFILCAGICNYGYIPLPLAESLFPGAVVTLMVHNVGVDLALWSIGILVISGGTHTSWRRAVLSPPLVAVVAALVLKQSGAAAHLPSPVVSLAGALAACAIPLGLMLSGAIIVDYLGAMRWDQSARPLVAGIGLRLLVMPVLMLSVARFLPLEVEMRQVLLLQAAMPAASFPIVLVRLYGQDTATALRVVLGTSLAAILTIPLWIVVGSAWLGL